MQNPFDNTCAVVTGGSRGIGAAVVQHLRAAGCRVAVLSTKTDHGLGDLNIACDVADEAQLLAAFQQIAQQWQKLDYAFVNAGVSTLAPLLDMDMKEWDRVMSVNVRAAVMTLRECAKLMKAQGGSVVTCCSLSTFKPEKLIAPYNASKAALASVTQTAAREWGEFGIRVNGVAPGLTRTDIIAGSEAVPGYHAAVQQRTPLQNRLGTADDIADAVLKLMSMAWVSGVIMPVDGGLSLHTPTDITEFF